MSKPTPTSPIPIRRERSASVDSDNPGLSVGSNTSQSPPQSPSLPTKPIPSSPILSYFLSKDGVPKSPTSLRTNLPQLSPTLEKEGVPKLSPVSPVMGHHRAMSMNSNWPRFPSSGAGVGGPGTVAPQNTPAIKDSHQRSAGIFRRLSLSGTSPFQRPVIPSNDMNDNAFNTSQSIGSGAGTMPRTTRSARRATLTAGDAPRPRAPSPIGERMLKGHFDGFV